MNNTLQVVQDKFIEGVARIANILGINSFDAKLYAFLYLSKDPKSLDEIAEALGVSKGNVSVKIRDLEKWGAVKNVWVKGSRKDFYQVELDIKNIFLNNMKSAIGKRINEFSVLLEDIKQILNSLEKDLNEEELELIASYKERFKKIEELKTLASTALVFAEKLL